MSEARMCDKCFSRYVVDGTGICPNCQGKGFKHPESKVVKKVEGKGKQTLLIQKLNQCRLGAPWRRWEVYPSFLPPTPKFKEGERE